MVTGTGMGLEVTLFPLLFIRTEKAIDMNDTEWWAQSQPYDWRAWSKNKILSPAAGGRNPAAAINPEEQDQASHYILWFSHRLGVHGCCRSRRPEYESAGTSYLIQEQNLLTQSPSCRSDSISVLSGLWSPTWATAPFLIALSLLFVKCAPLQTLQIQLTVLSFPKTVMFFVVSKIIVSRGQSPLHRQRLKAALCIVLGGNLIPLRLSSQALLCSWRCILLPPNLDMPSISWLQMLQMI